MSLDVWLTKKTLVPEQVIPAHYEETQVFDGNYTHNLAGMAKAAGIYEYLWRPEEVDCTKAGDLIVPLRKGLDLLLSDPRRFKEYEPENKWGSYLGFIEFVGKYLHACEENPDAEIGVSR